MKALKMSPLRNSEFEKLCTVIRSQDINRVAKRAKVAPATLYFWLDGTTTGPRLTTLVKVARAVGYDIKLQKVRK